MFNLQGSELVIILLLALVVLGPEKLPDAMRKFGQFVAQMKKMSSGFQQEFRNAVDEPMREVRETANLLRDSVDFRKLQDGERTEKPKSGEMAAATPVTTPTPEPEPQPVPDDPVTAPPASVASAASVAAVDPDQPALRESRPIDPPVETVPDATVPDATVPDATVADQPPAQDDDQGHTS